MPARSTLLEQLGRAEAEIFALVQQQTDRAREAATARLSVKEMSDRLLAMQAELEKQKANAEDVMYVPKRHIYFSSLPQFMVVQAPVLHSRPDMAGPGDRP
ncbi:hypothetical protein CBR_g3951 [Chara braunii]|uniref:Uncharacterized protein n=1 Tax=Chara braunii TaxID=69332 RepID=A0A388KGZ6_CHABU|nr:hypothetical protein CBR_g3951 [Chara braunii]|eukprot:GBG69253.1 hypothetical protein CBR_g3951 [Chara braunii]